MPGSRRARLLAAVSVSVSASAFALLPVGASSLPTGTDGAPRTAPPPVAAAPAEAELVPPTDPPPPPPGEPADAEFDRLARCESGGRWHLSSGNGYYGGLQFAPSTWKSLGGGIGRPSDHPREHQIEVARREWRRNGWRAWPACSRRLGLA
jgi:hypothetical protein